MSKDNCLDALFLLAGVCLLLSQACLRAETLGNDWVPTFSSQGLNGSVNALAFNSTTGNLYAGGTFTKAGGAAAKYAAQWNGSSWSALGSGLNKAVNALAFDSTTGNLYAGGTFTTAGGAAAKSIAKWNGSSWSALGSGLDGTVYALVCDNSGNLYAGGLFTTPANYLAKWDGSAWSAVGSGVNGAVYALAFDSAGNLYAGGNFTAAGGVAANYAAEWNGSAWSALGSGVSFAGVGSGVYALACDSVGNLYAGGHFTTAGGVTTNNVAEWNGAAWSALGSGMSGGTVNSYVNALACDSAGNLYAGSGFTTAGGVTVNYIAQWDGSSWSALGSGMSGGISPYIYALIFDSVGNLFAGGNFTTAGGESSAYTAEYLKGGSGGGGGASVTMEEQIVELEIALGTSPAFGGILAGTPLPLTISKIGVKLSFAQTGSDSISLSGKLPVPAGWVAAGQSVVIDVGGVVRIFTLDNKGNGAASSGIGAAAAGGPNDHFKLRVKSSKGVVAKQTASFTANFNKGAFTSLLSNEGLLGTPTLNNAKFTLPVIMIFNAHLFEAEQPVLYTVNANGVWEHQD